MIIDCHTHLNRYTPDLPDTLEARHALLRREMDANAVAYALVISSYDVTPDRPPTDEVLDRLADDPRLGVIAAATAEMVRAGDYSALRELVRTRPVKALKLYPGYVPVALTDERMRPFYELAEEADLPVMIHTGDTYERSSRVRFAHPLAVDDVAVEFRRVRFVMAHMGNPWFLDAAEVVYKNDNVFGDVSGLTLGAFEPRFAAFARTKLNEAVAFINDPTKLMFGTDWPIAELGSYLRFVETLELTDEEREGMMWRNAARVFRIDTAALE
ncbi:MAG TPA: amidohydrolase family protein [Longimicrobium sp.]|nr:amidohydrolase family protein [Longimicrobium sp.]